MSNISPTTFEYIKYREGFWHVRKISSKDSMANCATEEHAKLIVKALNCHDELVESLKLSHLRLLNAQNSNITTKEDDKAILIIDKILIKVESL